MATYYGVGRVTPADFRHLKWVGRTKSGKPVEIEMPFAFCRSNPDWKFEEKNDTVATVEFEGAYDDEKLAIDDRTEPWTLKIDGVEAGNSEIVLGVGKFYLGVAGEQENPVYVGLTRGGGSFIVEREFREINADEDPGLVMGRIEKEMARPKLTLNALQWLTKVDLLYNCVAKKPDMT